MAVVLLFTYETSMHTADAPTSGLFWATLPLLFLSFSYPIPIRPSSMLTFPAKATGPGRMLKFPLQVRAEPGCQTLVHSVLKECF